jgi:hypothetical protein
MRTVESFQDNNGRKLKLICDVDAKGIELKVWPEKKVWWKAIFSPKKKVRLPIARASVYYNFHPLDEIPQVAGIMDIIITEKRIEV